MEGHNIRKRWEEDACEDTERKILNNSGSLYSNSRNGATPSFFSINVQHLSHRFAFQRSPAVPAVKTPVGAVTKNT